MSARLLQQAGQWGSSVAQVMVVTEDLAVGNNYVDSFTADSCLENDAALQQKTPSPYDSSWYLRTAVYWFGSDNMPLKVRDSDCSGSAADWMVPVKKIITKYQKKKIQFNFFRMQKYEVLWIQC